MNHDQWIYMAGVAICDVVALLVFIVVAYSVFKNDHQKQGGE